MKFYHSLILLFVCVLSAHATTFTVTRSDDSNVDDYGFIWKVGGNADQTGNIGIYEFFPSAPPITISGRATTTSGRGIANIIINLADGTSINRRTRTTSFGYYSFRDLPGDGQTYVLSVKDRRFHFLQSVKFFYNSLQDATFNLVGDRINR
jgi:hypothetical protein